MQSILPPALPVPTTRKSVGEIETRFVKPNHAGFEIAGELHRSLTLLKAINHAGLVPRVGDRLRITVELLPEE
jgi:hypothetical protein